MRHSEPFISRTSRWQHRCNLAVGMKLLLALSLTACVGLAPGLTGSDAGSGSGPGSGSDAGSGSDTGTGSGIAGRLRISGAHIVDASGNTVRLTGVSWFGLETSNYAPHGLWARGMDAMLDQIVQLKL